MTDFKHKENSGAIFKNDKKTEDKHPDYTGTINVDGKEKQISLWIKEGKKGKFFSASIREPYVKQVDNQEKEVTENQDLPF